ncbi:MAG: hypothetical protein IT462_17665 [Planctomycetes bacterium]|nr:hypothetical protein [Planctomycetota bacterium]
MAIVRGDEERQFFGELLDQLKRSPWRFIGALISAPLLWVSANTHDWWAVGWFALAPLCFAATGGGWLASGLVGLVGFAAGAAAQCYWLTPLPIGSFVLLGLLAGLVCGAMEAPLMMRLPLLVRPLVFGLLIAGVYALVAVPAAMPGEALVNSAMARGLFRIIDLPVLAGLLALIARLASELYNGKGEGERRLGGWVGMLVAGLIVLWAAIDGLGVKLSAVEKPEGGRQLIIVTSPADPEKTTREVLGALGRGSVALWPAVETDSRAKADEILAGAENLAREKQLMVALTVSDGKNWRAAIYDRAEKPVIKEWGIDAPPERVENAQTSAGKLLMGTRWDQLGTSDEEIVFASHAKAPGGDSAEVFQLRQTRRRTLLEGVPQVHAWPGGGAVIDPQARLVERASSGTGGTTVKGALINTRMPRPEQGVSKLYKPQLRWMQDLLAILAPLALVGVLIAESVMAALRLKSRNAPELELDPEPPPEPRMPAQRKK